MGPTLFADTAFYIALFWPRDPAHQRAVAWQRYLTQEKLNVVTSEAVLWEVLNTFSAPLSRSAAVSAYHRVKAEPTIEVVDFDSTLVAFALALYAARTDKSWGITDCFSFEVMRARGIGQALTTDHHFEQAGFAALLLDPPP